MLTPPQYQRLMSRLRAAAEKEKEALLKSMPKEFKEQVGDVSIRFEDKPTKDMVRQGLASEVVSVTQHGGSGKTEIIVFLMTLYERYAAEPGAFRRELRRTLLMELADMAGVDVDLAD